MSEENLKVFVMRKYSLLFFFSLLSLLLFSQLPERQYLANNKESAFDFSALNWVDAFDSLHATLALRYPFTEWKAIDWDAKFSLARPSIESAYDNNDSVSYISALFQYLYDIPDGHIAVIGTPEYYKHATIGGSFGFNMIPADDGAVVVSYVPEESPAFTAGLRCGDRILRWNGVLIDSVEPTAFLNYARNYATTEGRQFSRYLMLSRGPLGSMADIAFQSTLTKVESTISLTAFDDERQLFVAGFFNTAPVFDPDSIISYHQLDNNIGYLKISAEQIDAYTPEEIMVHPDFMKVSEALAYFNQHDIDKLIVDLRFNIGGNDLQAAVTMGLFYETPSFYEHITGPYNMNYEVLYSLTTEPLAPYYGSDIAVLVDPNCISTGEGFAMMFDRLENAHIVSHWGTNGSFGMVDYDPILLPLGLTLIFPQAMSLDENYNIQLDSDSTLQGGVMPDIRVPLTVENIKQQWEQGVDVQLEYAKGLLLKLDQHASERHDLLFPNPCTDKVWVKFADALNNNGELVLFDLNGRQVYSESFRNAGSKVQIDLQMLPKGMYLYQFTSKNEIIFGKLLLQF